MKKRTQMEERQKRQGLPYGLLILAMLIFGTNGLLVSRISVQSGQIVLLRTLIGGALLSVIVLLRGGLTGTPSAPICRCSCWEGPPWD